MEDNFINLGNRKYQNRFAIKSDGSGAGAKAVNVAGSAIRFSGRNMTDGSTSTKLNCRCNLYGIYRSKKTRITKK